MYSALKLRMLILLMLVCHFSKGQNLKNWTIMHYAAGSNSSEVDLMNDVEEMKKGKVSEDYNFIMLIDRVEGHSEDADALDGNFTDTRLYQINRDGYTRLEGKDEFPEIGNAKSYDANMGDVTELKKFIMYCKKHYPARHYMLILRSHGNGFGMCPDAEAGERDRIFPAEMSNVLTQEESVDILGLDVCSMAGLENLYQWRPRNTHFSADYVIASAPLSGAWAYDEIMGRLKSECNDPQCIDPDKADPLELSLMFYEEIFENQRWSSWGLFDNSKVRAVKAKIDEASRSLVSEEDEGVLEIIDQTLGYYHSMNENMELAQLTAPYVDAYRFWKLIAEESEHSEQTRALAKEVCKLLDALVLKSYYGRGFLPATNDFVNGSCGVYQIIPQGRRVFSQTQQSFWSHSGWFHPDDRSVDPSSYGQYDWCSDGASKADDKVDNFFEYLDHLFDRDNDAKGGVNAYKY